MGPSMRIPDEHGLDQDRKHRAVLALLNGLEEEMPSWPMSVQCS